MKTVKELINALFKQDLSHFSFGVYALNNGYSIALKGSYPEGYDRLYGFIGGSPGKYTRKTIEKTLNEMGIYK